MPGREANAIFYLVGQAGLKGATATSGVLACDVCFQEAEKLISAAEIEAQSRWSAFKPGATRADLCSAQVSS